MQVTDYLHALKIPFHIPVAPGKNVERFVYVYLILGEEISLVDSGVRDSDGLIYEYLKNLGRKPEDISLLILTHAHPDHIGSAGAIRDSTGCRVAAHPGARAWIEDVDLQFKERPVPGFQTLVGGNATVDHLLQDGEIMDLGPVSFEMLHTPGHAAGAVSLYSREEKLLIAGDAVPLKNSLPIYEDAATTVRSIERLKDLPGINMLLASWAAPARAAEATKMLDEGLEYMQYIHGVIRKIAGGKMADDDPMELCAQVVKALGLPDVAVNPLVARSFVSHLRVIDREEL